MKVSEKTRTVSASIGLDDYDKLVKFANEEGTTTSDIIRIALSKGGTRPFSFSE